MPPDDRRRPSEELLLDRLRRISGSADPVPPEVTALAQGAFIHRSADTQMARLLEEESIGIRGGEALLLTFTGEGVSLNLADDEGSLIGHVSPPHARVELESPASSNTGIDVDEVGRFTLDDVTGPIRFHIHLEKQDVVTFWVTI